MISVKNDDRLSYRTSESENEDGNSTSKTSSSHREYSRNNLNKKLRETKVLKNQSASKTSVEREIMNEYSGEIYRPNSKSSLGVDSINSVGSGVVDSPNFAVEADAAIEHSTEIGGKSDIESKGSLDSKSNGRALSLNTNESETCSEISDSESSTESSGNDSSEDSSGIETTSARSKSTSLIANDDLPKSLAVSTRTKTETIISMHDNGDGKNGSESSRSDDGNNDETSSETENKRSLVEGESKYGDELSGSESSKAESRGSASINTSLRSTSKSRMNSRISSSTLSSFSSSKTSTKSCASSTETKRCASSSKTKKCASSSKTKRCASSSKSSQLGESSSRPFSSASFARSNYLNSKESSISDPKRIKSREIQTSSLSESRPPRYEHSKTSSMSPSTYGIPDSSISRMSSAYFIDQSPSSNRRFREIHTPDERNEYMKRSASASDWTRISAGIRSKKTDTGDLLLRWARVQPVFKARYELSGNETAYMQKLRKEAQDYYEHRKKVEKVKSVVDHRPPDLFTHVYYNPKKQKKLQERQDLIDKNNHVLLTRLIDVMTSTRIDNQNYQRDIHMANKRMQREKKEEMMMLEENHVRNCLVQRLRSSGSQSRSEHL